MSDACKLICRAALENFNTHKSATMRPKPQDIAALRPYITGKYPNGSRCMDEAYFRRTTESLQNGIERGLFSAKWNAKRGIYDGFSVSAEQLDRICQAYGWITRAAFRQAVENLLRDCLRPVEQGGSPAAEVRRWAQAELASASPACLKWVTYTPENPDCIAQAAVYLTRLTYGCERIAALTEDTLLRIFSQDVFHDSKFLENNAKRIAAMLDPAFEDTKQLFQHYHLLENPSNVLFKGHARITFSDGETLTLQGMADCVSFEPYRVGLIHRIDTDAVLTIENLTTFHDHADSHGLVVFTSGYANDLVLRFVRRAIEDNGLSSISHFGDLDGYGFDILRDLSVRLDCAVFPYKMDLHTFAEYRDKAKPLTGGNRQKFQALLQGGFFDAERQALFVLLLEAGLMLEQESVR